MDHYKKAIAEQISILSDHRGKDEKICLHFIRDHAMSIVQLSEQALWPRHRAAVGCGLSEVEVSA